MFRSPEYVKRYEYVYYDMRTPLNTQSGNNVVQPRPEHLFVVDNSTEVNPIDWYNAYLEVEFNMQKLANNTKYDGANDANTKMAAPSNGLSLIKELKVDCNSTRVYTNSRANETANIIALTTYSKPYADSLGKDQFFYPDENTGAAEVRDDQAALNPAFVKRKSLITGTPAVTTVKLTLPLYLWSYFASFHQALAPNMKTVISITLESDANVIYRDVATTDVGRIFVTKLRLWCPKIIFNGLGTKRFMEEFLKPKKWTILREHIDSDQTQSTNGFYRISTGIRRPRHVFIWVVPQASYNSQTGNIFKFNAFGMGGNHSSFTRARLEVNNSVFYPQLDYNALTEFSRLYRALMSFNSSYNNMETGTLINIENFRNLFGLIYFDLRNQEEDLKDSAVSLTFRYELSAALDAQMQINSLVLYEHELELYTDSGKLLIRA